MPMLILICAWNIRGSWGPLELNMSALSHNVVRTVGLVCCLPVLSVAYQNDSARALWKMLDKTVTCNTSNAKTAGRKCKSIQRNHKASMSTWSWHPSSCNCWESDDEYQYPKSWNGETAASLHWCCMTWQFTLSQELFFRRNGSCRERWSWQLFLSPFNLVHLSPYAFMLCGGICVCIWNKQATIISNSWYRFFPQGLHQNWIIYSAIPNINSSKTSFFLKPGKCKVLAD